MEAASGLNDWLGLSDSPNRKVFEYPLIAEITKVVDKHKDNLSGQSCLVRTFL